MRCSFPHGITKKEEQNRSYAQDSLVVYNSWMRSVFFVSLPFPPLSCRSSHSNNPFLGAYGLDVHIGCMFIL